MDQIQKPNDMFVAHLSAPQASLVDLLQNNITADNTEFLKPDEYREKPLIKKRYTQNNVFNEAAFLNDYLAAHAKFEQLTNDQAFKNLENDIEYSPSDRFRPVGGKIFDTSVSYNKIINPLHQQYSVSGINTISDPTITKEEAAQSNFIWDPKTQQFTDKTPETLSLWKKATDQTLIYAKWDEDGTHIDPMTGVEVRHQKGEWKTDVNGNYYTEYLGDRELRDKQVVALQDILTKEGSWLNKIDFYDSDGTEKSAFGVAMKTLMSIAPYCIPYFNTYYAGFTTVFGLMSVMPTFYKAMESVLLGDDSSITSSTATEIENWFRKFDPSRTQKGRENFFSFESLGTLTADVFAQLYQQRAAASVAKWFLKEPKAAADLSRDMDAYAKFMAEQETYLKNLTKWQGNLSLGYMGLVSTVDVYNDALNAGYDKRSAGIAALASAGALFGIMNFNETTRGIGTWMLNKTTGTTRETSRGVVTKAVKSTMNNIADGVKKANKGDKRALKAALTEFKAKVASNLEDALVVGGEEYWKGAIVEGVEEVTEEMVQDTIKGIMDTLAWLNITPSQGSFGGWGNVFSKQGAERYLQTFLGGAFGGAMFAGQLKFEQKVNPENAPRLSVDKSLQELFVDGRADEVFAEFERCKKYFNKHLSAQLYNVGDKQISMSTQEGEKSQADVVYDLAVGYARGLYEQTMRNIDGLKYNPRHYLVYQSLQKEFDASKFDQNYTFKKWENLLSEITQIQKRLEENNKKLKESENNDDVQKLIDQDLELLQEKQQEFENYQNGKQFADNTIAALLYLDPNLREKLLKLDAKSYARDVLNLDYDKLKQDGNDEWTQRKVDAQFALMNDFTVGKNKDSKEDQKIDATKALVAFPMMVELFKKTMPTIANPIKAFVQNENNKLWLKTARFQKDNNLESDTIEPIIKYLAENPKYWSLSDKISFDIAKLLEKDGAIDLSQFDAQEQKVLREFINYKAARKGVNVWNVQNLQELFAEINSDLDQQSQGNPFVQKLQELRQKKSKKKKESDANDEAVLSVEINRIDTNNLYKAQPYTQNIKLATVLDLISDDDAFVDTELLHMLETALVEESAETSKVMIASYLDALKNVLQNKYQTELVLTDPEGKQWRTKANDTDFSQMNSANVAEYLVKLEQLLKDISTLTSEDGQQQIVADNNQDIAKLQPSDAILELNDDVEFLTKLIGELTQTGLPAKYQQKWDLIRQKAAQENPLLSIVKNIAHKVGVNRDDVIAWLFQKESDIRHGGSMQLGTIDQATINDIANVLTFISAMLDAMTEATESDYDKVFLTDTLPLSVNSVLRNYYKLYEDDAQADLFPVFSAAEMDNVFKTLGQIAEKLETLSAMSQESVENDERKDAVARTFFRNNILQSLQKTIKVKDVELPIVPVSVDIDDIENKEAYVVECLHAFHKLVKDNIAAKKFTYEELLTEIVNEFSKDCKDGENIFDTDRTIIDACYKDGISPALTLEVVLQAIAIDQKTLTQRYAKVLKDKELMPRFDQELIIKSLIARSNARGKEVYRTALELIHKKFQDKLADLKLKDKAPAYDLVFLPGGAGVGKSTAIKLALGAVKPKNVILAAPTEDKVKDLQTELSADSEIIINKDVSGVVEKVLGENLGKAGNVYQQAVQKSLEEAIEKRADHSAIQQDGKVSINGREITFRIDIDASGIVQNIEITSNDDVFKQIVEEEYKDSKIFNKDNLLIIDEASHLDQLTIKLLNAISNSDKLGCNIWLAGDVNQIGTSFKLRNIDLQFNIQNFFVHRLHKLAGANRFKNSAKPYNLQRLEKFVNKFTGLFSFHEVTADDVSEFTSIVNSGFKYKDLMGDRITSNQAEFTEQLKTIVNAANNGKSIVVIYDDANQDDKEKIKKALLDAGLKKTIADSEIYFSLKHVQGKEADLSIIYNLKSENIDPNGLNIDIDAQKLYTALSRSKEFSLMYEDSTDGLIAKYNITSNLDSSVSEYVKDLSIYKRKSNDRSDELDALATSLETIEQEKIEITAEDDADGSEPEPDPEIPDDEEGNPPTNPTGTPSATQTDPRLPSPQDFKDAVLIYGYYLRLGINRNQTEELKQLNSSESVDAFMQKAFYESTAEDQHRDLLQFWALNKGKYSRGSTLLIDFVKKRNELFYTIDKHDKIGINIKENDSRDGKDFPYLKPNDHPEKEGDSGFPLTSVIKNRGEYNITMFRCGINKENGKYVWSKTISDWQQRFKTSGEVTYWIPKPQETSRAEKYIKDRKIKSANKIQTILDCYKSYGILLYTGINNLQIEGDNTANKKLISDFDKDGNQLEYFDRMMLSDFEALGFEIIPFDITKYKGNKVISALNTFRLNDIATDPADDRFNNLGNKTWVFIRPIGTTFTPQPVDNSMFAHIVMIQQIQGDKTIYDILADKVINPIKAKLIMQYIQFELKLNDVSWTHIPTELKQGKRINQDAVKQWKNIKTKFVEAIKRSTKHIEINEQQIDNNVLAKEVNTFLDHYLSGVDGKFNFANKAYINKECKIIADILKHSKGFAFDYIDKYDETDKSKYVVTRVFEPPRAILDFAAFDLSGIQGVSLAPKLVQDQPIQAPKLQANEVTGGQEMSFEDQCKAFIRESVGQDIEVISQNFRDRFTHGESIDDILEFLGNNSTSLDISDADILDINDKLDCLR